MSEMAPFSGKEQISFVKACQNFFTTPPHDRKVEIPEFKALTRVDKVELREMLIREGYNVAPLADSVPPAIPPD